MILIMFGIGLVLLGLLATAALVHRKTSAHAKWNYQSLFVLGICVLPLGLVFGVTVSPAFIGLAGMGAIYLVIALMHRDEWKDGPLA